MAKPDTPFNAVDVIVEYSNKAKDGGDKHYLLIQREDTGLLALAGGGVEGEETYLEAAIRELMEETGLTFNMKVDQNLARHPAEFPTKYVTYREKETGELATLEGMMIATGGGRDPRGPASTHVFFLRLSTDLPISSFPVVGGDDAKTAKWFTETDLELMLIRDVAYQKRQEVQRQAATGSEPRVVVGKSQFFADHADILISVVLGGCFTTMSGRLQLPVFMA